MSQPQAQHYTTEAEYLAFENDGDIRHEYVNRREKLLNYQRISSLRYYLLVSPEHVQVDYYQRNTSKQWELASLEKGEALEIQCGDKKLQLTLEDIYEDIEIIF